jgi:hypothetical protein
MLWNPMESNSIPRNSSGIQVSGTGSGNSILFNNYSHRFTTTKIILFFRRMSALFDYGILNSVAKQLSD